MTHCHRNAVNIFIVSLCTIYCNTNICALTINHVLKTMPDTTIFNTRPVPANSESVSLQHRYPSTEIHNEENSNLSQYSVPKEAGSIVGSNSVNDLVEYDTSDSSSDHQPSKARKGVNASIENEPRDGTDAQASHATSKSGISNFKNVVGETVTHSTSEMPKAKPEFTRDDSFLMNDIGISDVPPESKYIIPIVAVILTAPLLIVLFMFLYKKSIEFWERRHYRRMDFLIDGMYND